MRFFNRRRERVQPAPPANPAGVGYEVVTRTHPGTVRALNEDRLIALPEIGLWAIADGMGGHQSGDVAAQTVVDCIALAEPKDTSSVQGAVDRANQILRDRAHGNGGVFSGSTIVALLLAEGGYHCLWAGDSEIWLLRDGDVCKLTRDHSVVEELIRAGVVAEADRRRHPQAHVITRAVGVADNAALERTSGRFREGDTFLLCSDGLTSALGSFGLDDFEADQPLESLADSLLERALSNGASDNVTFILVRSNAGVELPLE